MYNNELNYNDVRMLSIESVKKTKVPSGLYWPCSLIPYFMGHSKNSTSTTRNTKNVFSFLTTVLLSCMGLGIQYYRCVPGFERVPLEPLSTILPWYMDFLLIFLHFTNIFVVLWTKKIYIAIVKFERTPLEPLSTILP